MHWFQRIAFASLLLSWGLFLSLQSGTLTDETEHCHVAWLIGHEHQEPMRDFFQHHQPLLWDVLQLYFRLGADGPEVLYFGRTVVLVCTGLSVLAFFLLPWRLSRQDQPDSRPPWMAGALSVFPLILFSLTFWNTLVIRPETLSMPLFLYSLLLWLPGGSETTSGRITARTFAAGVLVGAAFYSGPRFVLLGPAFLFLPANRSRLFETNVRRLFVLGCGALSFVGLYSVLMSRSLSGIVFNMEFARLLKPVGEGYFDSAAPLRTLMLLFSLLLVILSRFMTDHGKRRLLCQSIFGLCLLELVLAADWPFMYEHHFLIPAIWWGVMMASASVDLRPGARPPIPSLVTIEAVAGLSLCLAFIASDVVSAQTIVDLVQVKRAILARINRSDRVLICAALHPISSLDASYYIIPIGDAPGRLATAVKLAQARWPLPDCDYLADIRTKRPALVDNTLLEALRYSERQGFKELLKNYTQISDEPNIRNISLYVIYALKSPGSCPEECVFEGPNGQGRIHEILARPAGLLAYRLRRMSFQLRGFPMTSQVVFKQLASPTADSIHEAIGGMIDRLGLSGELVGKRSLLKINAMSDEVFPGRNTSPWVLDGVLRAVQSRFPETEFLIVDGDVAGSRQFDRACDNWGYRAIARRRDVRILNLSQLPVVTVPTSNHRCPSMEFPEIVLEADSIINLPVLKTHVLTGISCALKNHWGLLPRFRYQYHPFVHEVVAEINRQIKHTMITIVDGTICIEGSGPKTGVPRVCNVLFAGRDRVAVDAAVLDFIGMGTALAPHVKKAEEYGVGRTAFEIVGDELTRMPFQMPKKSSDVVSQIESSLRKVPGLGPLLYRPRIARVLGCIGTHYNRLVWMSLFGKRHLHRLQQDSRYASEFWALPQAKHV